jgi:hypothetical protein
MPVSRESHTAILCAAAIVAAVVGIVAVVTTLPPAVSGVESASADSKGADSQGAGGARIDDVERITFDGVAGQADEPTALYRFDGASTNLLFFKLPWLERLGTTVRILPDLPDGEHTFDLAVSPDAATVEIHQHLGAVTEPFPGCYPGPKPVRIWKATGGKVTLKKQMLPLQLQTRVNEKDAYHLSVRIEGLAVRCEGGGGFGVGRRCRHSGGVDAPRTVRRVSSDPGDLRVRRLA